MTATQGESSGKQTLTLAAAGHFLVVTALYSARREWDQPHKKLAAKHTHEWVKPHIS